MNLKNGTDLFKELVRAPNLAFAVAHQDLRVVHQTCEEHGDGQPHYWSGFPLDSEVCVACINTSRALSSVGRAGGRKGGKSLTPRKLEQLRAASAAASVKARERREARVAQRDEQDERSKP